jgi:hypothetical protein
MTDESKRGFPGFTAVWKVTLMSTVAVALLQGPALAVGFTSDFRLEDCTWSSKGQQNPYFSLQKGYRLVLVGEEDGEEIRAQVTVLRQTRRITFETAQGVSLTVRARVVEEREWEDGELVEVSRNWFARCQETSDIYYFGEDVDDYEDGDIVGHEGAWRSGVDGALPGIIMPGTFLLGAKYFQEIAPGVALDRGRNVSMGLDVVTPAGTFSRCVGVMDTNALEPDAEGDPKVYCPGIGIVMDEDLALVEYGRVSRGQE